MTRFNLFRKNKRQPPPVAYVPDMDEYAKLKVPEKLRGLHTYAKIVFITLFPIGCALSFFRVFFILCAAVLSLLVSYRAMALFQQLLNTKTRYLVFIAVPPVCLALGFLFGFFFVSQTVSIIHI